MIHLSSYHSNGLPTLVWPNNANLIGEKVYNPKIHFCERCNKPILIYGRLIPCRHVFCFTCANLCLGIQNQPSSNGCVSNPASTPPLVGPSDPSNNSNTHLSPLITHNHPSPSKKNNINDTRHQGRFSNLNHNDDNDPTDRQSSVVTNHAALENTNHDDGSACNPQNQVSGCHRCGNRPLQVERNTLDSIFVCQVEGCRRSYLSAKDLQAHVNCRHNPAKSTNPVPTGSVAAISASPYISTSTMIHMKHHQGGSGEHRQSSSSASTINNPINNNNSPLAHNQRRDREQNLHNNSTSHYKSNQQNNHQTFKDFPNPGRERERRRNRHRGRDRLRDRNEFQRDRDQQRDNKEYHRQSMQRAARWAEASAQMLEKGLSR